MALHSPLHSCDIKQILIYSFILIWPIQRQVLQDLQGYDSSDKYGGGYGGGFGPRPRFARCWWPIFSGGKDSSELFDVSLFLDLI